MPNLGNRTIGQDPSAANVRDPQQKGDEIKRSRGQDEHGKKAEHAEELPNGRDQRPDGDEPGNDGASN